ncbi:hypothetical protein BDR07DRAFT_1461533 [Suillus spraguei]|nr:hypothetical protein BDR07DRAFT_1461533 [Suillus spraguei]
MSESEYTEVFTITRNGSGLIWVLLITTVARVTCRHHVCLSVTNDTLNAVITILSAVGRPGSNGMYSTHILNSFHLNVVEERTVGWRHASHQDIRDSRYQKGH